MSFCRVYIGTIAFALALMQWSVPDARFSDGLVTLVVAGLFYWLGLMDDEMHARSGTRKTLRRPPPPVRDVRDPSHMD